MGSYHGLKSIVKQMKIYIWSRCGEWGMTVVTMKVLSSVEETILIFVESCQEFGGQTVLQIVAVHILPKVRTLMY